MSALPATVTTSLEQLGVAYEVLDCDPALADTATFCEHYGIDPRLSANTLLIKAKTGEERFVACLVLSHTRLDVNRSVRKRIGSRRVSFASAEETRAITGMELGGVTPPGLPADLPLWVDQRIMQAEFVILGGGNRSTKLKLGPELFERMPNAEIVDGLAREVEPVG